MGLFLSSLEDDEWKRVRRIVTPTFSPAKLKSVMHIMRAAGKETLATLAESAENGHEINLKSVFGDFTMAVISRAAFACEPTPQCVTEASRLFTFPFWRKFLDYVAPMCVLDALGFTVLPPGPMAYFRRLTLRAIAARRAAPGCPPRDFLQLLLDSRAPPADSAEPQGPAPAACAGAAAPAPAAAASPAASTRQAAACAAPAAAATAGATSRATLTDDEVLAQSVLFFSVGYETASQVLMYAAYCLALNPACQDTLIEELADLPRDATGQLAECSMEALDGLVYLDAVVKETMRLYPPVLRMERRASEDFVLGDTGITVTKGMMVGIPVWAMQHASEYFEDPQTFQPTRFFPENAAGIVESTYLPFGQGPRDCIGKKFAVLEIKLLLAEIMAQYRFTPCANTAVPLTFFPTGRPLLGPPSIYVAVEKHT